MIFTTKAIHSLIEIFETKVIKVSNHQLTLAWQDSAHMTSNLASCMPKNDLSCSDSRQRFLNLHAWNADWGEGNSSGKMLSISKAKRQWRCQDVCSGPWWRTDRLNRIVVVFVFYRIGQWNVERRCQRSPFRLFKTAIEIQYNRKKTKQIGTRERCFDKWSDKLYLHSQTLSFKTAGWAGEKRRMSDSDLQL